MLRPILLLVLIAFSNQLVAKVEKLSLNAYPSTYLEDCEGIAYIYKANNQLHLGIRAVRNCKKIEIDGNVQNMERYHLGYRFETVVPALARTEIIVRSKYDDYHDRFVVLNRNRGGSGHNPPHNQSLEVLKLCGNGFRNTSMKTYCHDLLQTSNYNVRGIVEVCAKKRHISSQKNCLQEAVKFEYEPVNVMLECEKYSNHSSVVKSCYDVSRKYNRPPLKVLSECRTMYSRSSQQLNCVERFVNEKKPARSLGLLKACKDEFSRDSLAQNCYDKISKVKLSKKKTLSACSNQFNRTSQRFECLDLAARLNSDPAAIITECGKHSSRDSESLKCIKGFAH
ncbi:hypothetical protein [Aliikangiella coralliicola]|uniref:Uncharacterized protein n=1 Tax=Aliikangiella coralliicola TaxID=2592383 RepID=A0A545UFX9_9GAMM|nr:hypothetical protein [Aliikangiella coralliicola]TQV88380.1 hypothetical protein FLL46_07605 [Aliikangiella coralliicola]